jgi:uracil-DNA glycosylase
VTEAGRRSALEAIAAEIRGCTACRLHRSRTNAVPGEGSQDTEVVFVGEGPGFNEDQQGRPFVGAAGGLLGDLLAFIRWRREDVFIANVVKCRPPGNRDPEPDEIAACAPFLRRQLATLDPAVVVTLGRHSLGTFAPGARIGSVHGTVRPVDPATGLSRAVLYAMYHPAAAFRQTALRETLFADMAGLPQVLIDARLTRDRPAVPATAASAAAPTPAISATLDLAAASPGRAYTANSSAVAADSSTAEMDLSSSAADPSAAEMDADADQMALFAH